MLIEIVSAEETDIKHWMMLAEQVVPLFGEMPGFESILRRKVAQKQAYCARIISTCTPLIGGVLIGGAGREHFIRWLAVSAEHRRLGAGRLLVEKAVSVVPANSSIYVDTFVRGSAGAEAANKLYQSCGFVPAEVWQKDGLFRQRYIRSPSFEV